MRIGKGARFFDGVNNSGRAGEQRSLALPSTGYHSKSRIDSHMEVRFRSGEELPKFLSERFDLALASADKT